ncbi:MAG: hypothetical protein L6R37_005515 [Teloschistes peruensis]|nr:MAG: hypothetical protein L6R37_005515 [Teloschistes peruensis]
MDAQQFKKALLTDYLDNISSRHVQAEVQPGYLKNLLPACAPQDGQSWDQIHGDLFSKIMPGMTHWYASIALCSFLANRTHRDPLQELAQFPGILSGSDVLSEYAGRAVLGRTDDFSL